MQRLKNICWDIDDVLNNLMYKWLLYCKDRNSILDITYSDLTDNPPNDILNISLQSYLDSLDKFRQEEFACLLPEAEIYNWFRLYGVRYRHFALTAVPLSCCDISAQWLMKHYGRWIRSFNFVPSKRANDDVIYYEETKADFFLNSGFKVDVFIDDSEKNVKLVKETGIKSILFPRPWNSNRDKKISWFIRELNSFLA